MDLAGMALRYLIGASYVIGVKGAVTVFPYDVVSAGPGVSVGYCNLFDEHNTGAYGPYLHESDTAEEYGEGQIDPRGPGWAKNLRGQFERRKRQGFEYVELDNADAYSIRDVQSATDMASLYGLKVIAKNPGLLRMGARPYVGHPNVHGVIVERGAGTPADMHAVRNEVGKPDLPVWFVSFGTGRRWADSIAREAEKFRGMGVTYSNRGEYGNSINLLVPKR
jgi:hypothetical protein